MLVNLQHGGLPTRYERVAKSAVLSIDNTTRFRSLISSIKCLTMPRPGLLDKRFSKIVMRSCNRSPERTGSRNLTCQSKPPKKSPRSIRLVHYFMGQTVHQTDCVATTGD